MHRHRTILIAAALGALSLLTIFIHFGAGSIHNYDDSLYAQVSREVSNGHLRPLTFDNRPYVAKPPLFFWVTGSLVKILGDHDAIYRLPAAISLLALLAMAGWFLWKRCSEYTAILAVVLLLGSPILLSFSRRVMLEIPLILVATGLVLALQSRPSHWMLMAIFASIGWWTKDLAILPALFAGIAIAVWQRERPPLKELLPALLLLLASFILLQTYRALPSIAVPSLEIVRRAVLPIHPSQSIYVDLFIGDHPLLLLFPVALGISLWRRRQHSRLTVAFGLSALAYVAAVTITASVLPHYLLPFIPFSLLSIAVWAGELEMRPLRMGILMIAVLQLMRVFADRIDPKSLEIDPAPATKILSAKAESILPLDTPLCIVDAYWVGFYFYSKRETLGLTTTARAYDAQRVVPEVAARLLPPTAVPDLPATIASQCGGYAVVPNGLARSSDRWRSIETVGPLTLVGPPG